jgi:hypothetical protein
VFRQVNTRFRLGLFHWQAECAMIANPLLAILLELLFHSLR